MKLSKIKEIIKIMGENNIEELELKSFFHTLRIIKIRTHPPIYSISPPVVGEKVVEKKVVEEKVEAEKVVEEKKATYIKAPMVGTFYRSSSPGVPPYVEVGDRVIPGKIVCIIEAMKVMNEIESDVSGTIKEVLVKNEDPVEYGQPLFLVEPD